jgi:hypothetical protein
VFDVVAGRVFLGILDGFWDDVHAADFACLVGEPEADGAYATVSVCDFFFACEAGGFFDFVIELDGLLVELEEGPGGQLEAQVPECFLDVFFPVHMARFFSEDQGCFFTVDILHD